MFIIIDYDETFTANKVFWTDFIIEAEYRDIEVICCTNRVGNEYADADVFKDIGGLGIEIVFAAEYRDKWEAVTKAGYHPENAIWIDDRPMYIWQNRDVNELPD